MYPKFLQLEQEKQDRIIQAAIKVFSQKRYKDAGTDEIVKEAGISKGSLFHYFKNKKDLYHYMYNYAIEVMMEEFYGMIDLSERDFLQRWMQVLTVKLGLLRRNPYMTNFIKNVYLEEDEVIKLGFELQSQKLMADAYAKLLEDIDLTLFREDIDVQLAISTIISTLESYAIKQQTLLGFENIDEEFYEKVMTPLDGYIQLFKKCFYKGGNEL
ncbi:MAG: TetR/AcrR family transcriptional regulator [Vallitaleaceae bacterium]|nr:TetR/AcrR family transcriptional regulator [Vallitaleaceae bacterium]